MKNHEDKFLTKLDKKGIFFFFLTVLLLSSFSILFARTFTSGRDGISLPSASRAPIVMPSAEYGTFQLAIREKSADFLGRFSDNPSFLSAFLFLFAVFVYGILHGAGPGHRKTVVFTIFLSRPAKKWEPLAAGFLSAGLHAGSSLILFIFFNIIWKSISAFSHSEITAFYLEGWTFIILAGFAIILVFLKVFGLITGKSHGHPNGNSKNIYYLLIISSLFPCPGATMLLIFAMSYNLIFMGVLSVFVMSVGMGIIISFAGYLGMAGRDRIFGWFKKKEKVFGMATNIFELLSYLIIAAFSFWMGSPFIFWLIRGM